MGHVDPNLRVEKKIKEDIKFYNVLEEPFKVYGVFKENGKFRRMPEEVARSVSPATYRLHTNMAGGRVRFKTDSPYIAVNAVMSFIERVPHMPMTGSSAFDLYIKRDGVETYKNTFIPPYNMDGGYESVIDLDGSEMREVTINFPLYSDVDELYIGVSETAKIDFHPPYKIEKPIVYYGSSITQGGCASRAGNSYQGMISRRFDCNYINLGFSGNAKAEKEMSDYIKKLDMSAFIYDYDHNAPTVEHLEKTHERMFKEIREENPDLPIVLMTRPNVYLEEHEKRRIEIATRTYENAIAAGDKNVYFIPGPSLMEYSGPDGKVDISHPTDLGFMSMARVLGDLLEKEIIHSL